MEAAGLGLGSLVIIIMVMAYYGLFRPVEVLADNIVKVSEIASKEVDVLAEERKVLRVKRINSLEVSEDEVTSAKAKKALLKSLDI